MKRDLKESFEMICSGSANVKKHIHEIRQHLISRDQAQQWARRLRFITMGDKRSPRNTSSLTAPVSRRSGKEPITIAAGNGSPSGNESDSSSSTSSCLCEGESHFKLRRDGTTPKRLHLSEPDEIWDCTHYVAVSYRWPSRSVKREEAYTVRTSNGDRKNRAPKNILDRAIRFAIEVGLKLIWIDQECIEQDDRLDKECGIQSMDRVFQNAEIAIAALNCKISKQEHLDALFDILEARDDMSRDEMVHALEAIELILADDWHSRAWCFQEISVSEEQMTFLIERSPDLVLKQDLAKVWCRIPGEIEIDAFELYHATTALFIYEERYPDLAERINAVHNSTSTVIAVAQRGQQRDPLDRYEFNAAQAMHYLATKYHSRIPDGLAIMANLCNYSIRLDTAALEQYEQERGYPLSLSLCVYTLAIANGDFSFLFGSKEENKSQLVASWILCSSTSIGGLDYIDGETPLVIAGCEIQAGGVAMPGFLWRVEDCVDLTEVQSLFSARWKKAVMNPVGKDMKLDVEIEILQEILNIFCAKNLVGPAKIIWNSLTIQIPQKMVAQHQRTFKNRLCPTSLEARGIEIDTKAESGMTTLYRSQFEFHQWIIRRAVECGTIYHGSLISQDPFLNTGNEAPSCIFDVNGPCCVFTPLANGGEPQALVTPISWTIRRQEQTESGHVVLQGEDLVKGRWSGNNGRHSRYILI